MWSRIAWIGVVLGVLAALTDTVVLIVRGEVFTTYGTVGHGWPIITMTGLVSAVMGAVILGRDARQPIGWLLLLPGIQTCLSLALDAYSGWVMLDGGPGGELAGLITGWLASFLGAQIPLAANAVILLLAPEGVLSDRRWRPAVVAAVLGAVCWATPTIIEAAEYAGVDPQGGPLSRVLFLAGVALVVAAVLAGVVSLIVKLRGSTGPRRMQIRWFLIAGAPLAGGLVWLLVVRYLIDPDLDALSLLPLFAAELVFPLSIAIAVLRYRLYDIDLVLNRAWLVLGATVFVSAGYVVAVVTVGSALDGFWSALVVSAALACAFQPLRSRLVVLADRLAYGERVEPYVALSELSGRLGAAVGPPEALVAVADACLRSTSVIAVRIELTGPDSRLVAAANAPAGSPLAGEGAGETFPITDGSDVLGAVRVVPAPGRPLRPKDRAALVELCSHCGVAFRNLLLDAALERKVDELAAAAAALEQSRDRLQQARRTEQQQLEATVGSSVTPSLFALADRLDGMVERPPADGPAWVQVTAEVTRILATVRAVSHGVHSGLLESYGLAPAIAAYVGRSSAAVALRISDDLRSRRFDSGCESTVYTVVVTALRAAPGVRRIEMSLTESDVAIVLTFEQDTAIPAAVRDQVEAREGSLITHTADGVSRWLIRIPAVVLKPPVDVLVANEPECDLMESRPA